MTGAGRAAARILTAVWMVAVLCAGVGAEAQDAPLPASGVVLTVDPERLFAETVYGQRVQAEVETRAAALSAENRRIEAELVAEERDLTEQRPTLSVEAFRELADAFDAKVERIREEQDAKSRDVLQQSETGRQEFLAGVVPVLSQLLLERGGTALFDRRNVFLSLDAADITDAAVARIDAVLGDGSAPPARE